MSAAAPLDIHAHLPALQVVVPLCGALAAALLRNGALRYCLDCREVGT